jgi:type III secretory pathway component EscV
VTGSVLLGSLLFDNASEGTHVIEGMLIVGLIFLTVIAIGQFVHWAGHRRAERRRARRQAF